MFRIMWDGPVVQLSIRTTQKHARCEFKPRMNRLRYRVSNHIQGFPSQFRTLTLFFTAAKIFFNSYQMVYLFQHEISVSTHDFQHITKNCQTQTSLGGVENHAVEIKHYFDGNEMSDRCGTTFCMR